MAFHYSLFLSREAHPAQRIHCLCGSAMLLKNGSPQVQVGENSKQKRALFFLILNISFRKGHPYPLNYKLARNGFSAVVAFLQARKYIFRLSSLSPFWLIRFFLRASAWFAPFVLHFFVIPRFSLRFSDSRDPTLISDLFKCQLHVLGGPSGQFSYHCWKPLRLFGCVLPVCVSHTPKASFFFFIFLPVGFVQIDVCRGRLVLLRYALPVGCYIFCLFHPVPALRQKIFVFDLSSQRNKEV